ncbi:MAG: endonuclease [Spirochaetota bacterium]|nr:endonuclease [Spirochaetota bacterium]
MRKQGLYLFFALMLLCAFFTSACSEVDDLLGRSSESSDDDGGTSSIAPLIGVTIFEKTGGGASSSVSAVAIPGTYGTITVTKTGNSVFGVFADRYATLSGGWNNGDYWQIEVFEGTFDNLVFDVNITGSNTGPGDWKVMYSYDLSSPVFLDAGDLEDCRVGSTGDNLRSIAIPGGSGKLWIRIVIRGTGSLGGATFASGGNAGFKSIRLTGDLTPTGPISPPGPSSAPIVNPSSAPIVNPSSAPIVNPSSGGGTYSVPSDGVFAENMALPQTVRDYYRNAYGLSGSALKTALQTIITTGHSALGYNWDFQTMDSVTTGASEGDAGFGKVWDIYTTTTNAAGKLVTTAIGGTKWFTWGAPDQDTGSGGGTPGDKYNREHTWPQTFFNENEPAVSDRHHLYPTDKKLNGDHANLPYGEVTSAVTAAPAGSNGSRLGTARSGLGHTGNVFEIADLYKGDLARAHFYMAVRYYNSSSFNKDAVFASTGAKLKTWYSDMLRSWHTKDPVSQKEIDRNDAVKAKQGNRNPFIDYPVLVDLIDFVN